MKKLERPRLHPGKRFCHRPRKQFERNHRRNRVAGKAEEIFVAAGAFQGPRSTRNSPEYNRTSWLNLRSREKKFRMKFGENLLDQVVASHRNAAGHDQEIALQTL